MLGLGDEHARLLDEGWVRTSTPWRASFEIVLDRVAIEVVEVAASDRESYQDCIAEDLLVDALVLRGVARAQDLARPASWMNPGRCTGA